MRLTGSEKHLERGLQSADAILPRVLSALTDFPAVVVGSVKAQLQASASNTKLLSLLHFNPEGAVDVTRAVGVAWVPGTNASLFAAAHQSGNIYLYQPVLSFPTY